MMSPSHSYPPTLSSSRHLTLSSPSSSRPLTLTSRLIGFTAMISAVFSTLTLNRSLSWVRVSEGDVEALSVQGERGSEWVMLVMVLVVVMMMMISNRSLPADGISSEGRCT